MDNTHTSVLDTFTLEVFILSDSVWLFSLITPVIYYHLFFSIQMWIQDLKDFNLKRNK